MMGRGFYPGMGGGGWGWGAGLLMMVFWLIVLAGIVLLIVYASRGRRHYAGPGHDQYGNRVDWMSTGYYGQPQQDVAYQQARERYARGEISAKEFDDISERLGYGRPAAAQESPENKT